MPLLEAGQEEEVQAVSFPTIVLRVEREGSEFLRVCELRIEKVNQNIVQHSLYHASNLSLPSLSCLRPLCLLPSCLSDVLCFNFYLKLHAHLL